MVVAHEQLPLLFSGGNTQPRKKRVNRNLNASDSGLHHTISLMYDGGRHIGFRTSFENKLAAPTVQSHTKKKN
ncbi:hypothetical protein DPMN_067955 [Dreissena polymorpha]|uniref:Uncharacterized protein n=1 Tax=Dreissena polymorpha TaxID=45954 RepID=A0A9D3YW80_DREPO|nr:hypothetical protein DPMN_067955 [Dreissena polymorpha]